MRIEQLLGNSNKSWIFILISHTIIVLPWIIIHTLGNPRNQTDKCFFCAMNQLDEPKIIFINACFDSYPLVRLYSWLDYNFTCLHNISHFINWNHADWFLVNSTQSLDYLFNMLRLKSFTVNDPWTQTGMKDVNYI